jgi:Ca-activated chloride channel family protein
MDFANPHFENPERFWLLAAALVCAVALIANSARARRRQLASFADENLVGRLLSAHSPMKRAVKNALLLLAIVFLGVALARPQWGLQAEKLEQQGEDTIFVLDTSKSMLVADVRPNRLERAKLAMMDYVRRHGSGRVGLVVFAGQAFLQCPLTLDYDAFIDTLRSVDVNAVPVPGSDVGRGLDEAARALEKNPGRKLIVLLTDGEDLAGAGVKKAEELARQKVTIYTVGLGTEAGGLIQIYGETGAQEALRDQNGQTVVSHLDEKTLRAIAEATGGEYQALGAIGEGMDKVRIAVTLGTTKLAEGLVRTSGVDRFHTPLGVAIVLLVAESLTGTRRRIRNPISA